MNNKLLHLPSNAVGRDFVVGDIHGVFDDLQYVLSKGLNFDVTKDRLISVGDLIDRGPASMECTDLLYEPWFHAVRGNHEQLAIDYLLHEDRAAYATWFWNGGNWHANYDKRELKIMAEKMDTLPLIISVGYGEDRYNVVHADLMKFGHNELTIYTDAPSGILVTDDIIDAWQFSKDDEHAMMWGRYIIGSTIPHQHPTLLSPTFVGHTPCRHIVRAERQIYLDTGAVFYHVNNNKSEQLYLSFACPAEQVVYMYNMMHRTITVVPFDEIPQAR